MTANTIVSRSLRSVAVLGFMLGVLASCENGPTEPPVPRPTLTPADTVELDFEERSSVSIQPIAGTGRQIVLDLDGVQAGDSLAARLRGAGVTIDSVIRAGVAGERHSLWIPRAQSGNGLELDLVWIRRAGAAKVKVFLREPTGEPEHTVLFLTPGDTVVEYLDGDGDYDQFFVNSPVGTRITVWAQLDSASQPIRFRFAGKESVLTDRMTLPFAIVEDLAFSSQIVVGVQAAPGTFGAPDPIAARYRVWVKAVDLAPETDAATAVSGDTIVERIDAFGDFDRFEIPLAQGQEFRVLLARDSLSASPVRARLRVIGESTVSFTLGAGDSVLDLRRSEWIQKPDGSPAIVEVFGDPNAPVDHPPQGYRVLYQRRPRAPEVAPATLGLVDSVVTENLSSCADADDFELTGRPNTYVHVYLGAVLHGAPGCRVRVRLLLGDGSLGDIDSVRLGTDTDVHRSPPIVVPPAGVVRLRIEGVDAPGQPIGRAQNVGYVLDLYAPDSTPEIAPVAVTVGDSIVTETIDRCTDSDVFDIVGTPGTIVTFTFGFGRSTTCGLALSSENFGSGFMLSSANADALRFGHVTIPPSGHAPLRVSSDRLGTGADRGAPYFVRTEAVNTAPELGSALLALGDTVQETMSRCGDIDRWQLQLVEGEGVWLRFDRARAAHCLMEVTLSHAPGWPYAQLNIWPSDSVGPLLRYFIPPATGGYELTVLTYPSGHTDDRGLPYSAVITGAVNEVAPSALAVGDTSVIEPWNSHDIDFFVVPLQAGVEYVAASLGRVDFTAPVPEDSFGVSFEPYTRAHRRRFVPTSSGDYKFRVDGDNASVSPVSYRFTVNEVHRTPESINDTLSAGDTTAVESFDHVGDEDDFTALLTPGRYFRLRAFPAPGTTGGIISDLSMPPDGIFGLSEQTGWSTSRIGVPPSGRVNARLLDWLVSADTTVNPSYRLRLVEIDPAPESRAATLAPADSITDEPLGDAYDLDEFQFTPTATGSYAVRFSAASTCGVGDDQLRMVVRNGANVVATVLSRTDAATAGTVALASGIAYTLAVEAVDPVVGDCVMRTYRARLTLQP